MELVSLFDTIAIPTADVSYQFSAVPVKDNSAHRLAKDKLGNPALLLVANGESELVHSLTMQLQNVVVAFNVGCVISQNNVRQRQRFTTIAFQGHDELLRKYFLKLCSVLLSELGDTPTHQQIRREVTFFAELLRMAVTPAIKTVQGLWAELLLIRRSAHIENLLQCWHNLPEEKFDFSDGDERIEVKSSANGFRIHSFSLDQLSSPNGTRSIIASILVRPSAGGETIESLVAAISERVSSRELVHKLRSQVALTLGSSIANVHAFPFDYELAVQSLQFYRAEDVPKIDFRVVPDLVSEVKFKADISSISPISERDFGLYRLIL